MQYNIMAYCLITYCTLTYLILTYGVTPCYHMQCHAIPSTKSYYTAPHNTIQHHIISYHVITFHIIPYDKIPDAETQLKGSAVKLRWMECWTTYQPFSEHSSLHCCSTIWYSYSYSSFNLTQLAVTIVTLNHCNYTRMVLELISLHCACIIIFR